MNLLDTCELLVKLARKAGAAEAEAYAERTREASVRVRDGEVEELHQASSKGIGLRVICGQRLGFAYGTDLSKDGLKALAGKAVALAKGAAKDPANGLPRGAQLGAVSAGEYDPAIEEIAPEWKLHAAREAEKAARAEDPRVRKFDSTGAGDFLSQTAIASSHGARGESRASYAYVYCSPVAEADGQLQTASWIDTRRTLATLQSPEEVGRIAARRAARMLGARKPKAKSTSSASRAGASLPSIGTSNFYLQAGTEKPEAIVKSVKNGLYVTAMLGRGADVVTGDYSRGANGIWIENGELAYPVQEITVSGNLLEMLQSIDAVGDDLDFRSSVAAPTLRFAELQVSGA